jgi:hypothetical protein
MGANSEILIKQNRTADIDLYESHEAIYINDHLIQ